MQKNELHDFVRNTMRDNELRFTKSLGQNFLIDESVLQDIIEAAGVTNEDYVLEIGPGIGVLTRQLALNAKAVVAVEIDRHMIEVLNNNLSEFTNVSIINEDILKINIDTIKQDYFHGNNFKVVANLPYYITTPIVMGLLENKCGAESLTVMVQKEVAERMRAKSGKEYGALSVAAQYYGNVSIERIVKASSFMPAPKVDSAVVKIDVYEKPQVEVKSEKIFFQVVRAAFNQRRKTLLNSLSGSPFLNGDKDELGRVLDSCGIDKNIRAEKLSILDFAKIANQIV